jgi:hypothetical protein
MTDRELLELAAKTYWGNEIDDVCSIEWDSADNCIAYTHADNQDHNGNDVAFLWNPLTDDGDALRLAVKLNIDVFGASDCRVCEWDDGVVTEQSNNDPYTATRRAITRAAAEIGKEMK